jgi:hypothetical protein
MQASIAVAREAANAAAKSAAASARAVVDIQRALIVPTQFHSTAIVRNDRVIAYRITAVFENTGTTVARRFTGTASIVMWKGLLPEDFKYPDRMEAIAPNAFVAPRLKIPFPVDIAIQDLLDIMNKKMRGFIYGWVEYDDVFTSSARRRTEFCVEIEVIGNPLVTPSKGAPESRQARGRRLLWALLDPEDITQPMKIASTNQAKNRQSGTARADTAPCRQSDPLSGPLVRTPYTATPFRAIVMAIAIVPVRQIVGVRTAAVCGSRLTARDRSSARLRALCACPAPARPFPRRGRAAAARRRPRGAARCSRYLRLSLGPG